MRAARNSHTATRSPSGQVLLVGGCSQLFTCGGPANVELYDPGTGAFTLTGSLLAAPVRTFHTATLAAQRPGAGRRWLR